jgi:hypothetical protein
VIHAPVVASLKPLLDGDRVVATGNACQRCAGPLAAEHDHVANVQTRHLLCVCAACYTSLPKDGEAGDSHRAVPRRYLRLLGSAVTDEDWDAFEIPVGIAFFFHNSALGRTVAAYPSPVGATESLLSPETWDRVLRANPWVRTLVPDVEAVLVRRSHDVRDCFVVPIDACYELTGRIRQRWSGFAGGPAVREEIDSFFVMLRERSEVVAP